MKYLATIFILLSTSLTYGQTQAHKEKFEQLEPDVWLGIWDNENALKKQ